MEPEFDDREQDDATSIADGLPMIVSESRIEGNSSRGFITGSRRPIYPVAVIVAVVTTDNPSDAAAESTLEVLKTEE